MLLKNWGSAHQDLGQNERLPLPHTKGTKPAPSTVKVLVYLLQVKRNFEAFFNKIFVPVEGLEPPLFCKKWILNPSRLPIPPHRQYFKYKII